MNRPNPNTTILLLGLVIASATMMVLTAVAWLLGPDRFAVHWDVTGAVDAVTPRAGALLPLTLATLALAGLAGCARSRGVVAPRPAFIAGCPTAGVLVGTQAALAGPNLTAQSAGAATAPGVILALPILLGALGAGVAALAAQPVAAAPYGRVRSPRRRGRTPRSRACRRSPAGRRPGARSSPPSCSSPPSPRRSPSRSATLGSQRSSARPSSLWRRCSRRSWS